MESTSRVNWEGQCGAVTTGLSAILYGYGYQQFVLARCHEDLARSLHFGFFCRSFYRYVFQFFFFRDHLKQTDNHCLQSLSDGVSRLTQSVLLCFSHCRARFEGLCSSLWSRCVEPVHRVLSNAGLQPQDINTVGDGVCACSSQISDLLHFSLQLNLTCTCVRSLSLSLSLSLLRLLLPLPSWFSAVACPELHVFGKLCKTYSLAKSKFFRQSRLKKL